MKKGYEMIIKAIEVTKKYTSAEVKQLAGLFLYLNKLDINDENNFGTGVSAKGLYKLLAPLTRTGKKQEFREWWESVSNTARLKENIDYEVREIITKVENGLDKQSFDLWENSQQAKMYGKNKSLHFLAKILIKGYHSYMYYFRKHGINNVYVIPNSFRNL